MKKIVSLRSAESLVEVLIAIFVFSMASMAAFSLMISAMGGNESIKNRTIALNLAREGIEAVRTIRDTNWQEWGGTDAPQMNQTTAPRY